MERSPETHSFADAVAAVPVAAEGDPQLDDSRGHGWIATLWRILVLLGVVILFVGMALWLEAVGALVLGMFWIAHWHARTFGFRCPRCHRAFTVSTLWDLVTPQSLDRDAQKYLICPACGHVAWMPILRRQRHPRH